MLRLHFERCTTFGVGLERCGNPRLGYTQANGSASCRALYVNIARESVGLRNGKGGSMLQVNVIVVDEFFRQSDERDVACEAAVIEPIDSDRGDAVHLPGRVHSDNDEVVARLQNGCDFAIKGSESAFMIADALLVDPDERLVIGCAYMQKSACIGTRLVGEVALVPNDSFVTEQGRVLRVPVAGDL